MNTDDRRLLTIKKLIADWNTAQDERDAARAELVELQEANERLALRAALAKDHLRLLRQRIEQLCERYMRVPGDFPAVVRVSDLRAALAGAAPAGESTP